MHCKDVCLSPHHPRTTDDRWGNRLHCTAKINSLTQIFKYGQSIFCLSHRPIFIFLWFIPSLGVHSPCHQQSPDSTPSATKTAEAEPASTTAVQLIDTKGGYMIRKWPAKHSRPKTQHPKTTFLVKAEACFRFLWFMPSLGVRSPCSLVYLASSLLSLEYSK